MRRGVANVHRLRHTFATHLVQEGVGLVTLRDLLGHRQITSTQIYVHLTAQDLRKATDKHPVSKLIKRVQELLPDVRPEQYCARLGWEPIERDRYLGAAVTVMSRALK